MGDLAPWHYVFWVALPNKVLYYQWDIIPRLAICKGVPFL